MSKHKHAKTKLKRRQNEKKKNTERNNTCKQQNKNKSKHNECKKKNAKPKKCKTYRNEKTRAKNNTDAKNTCLDVAFAADACVETRKKLKNLVLSLSPSRSYLLTFIISSSLSAPLLSSPFLLLPQFFSQEVPSGWSASLAVQHFSSFSSPLAPSPSPSLMVQLQVICFARHLHRYICMYSLVVTNLFFLSEGYVVAVALVSQRRCTTLRNDKTLHSPFHPCTVRVLRHRAVHNHVSSNRNVVAEPPCCGLRVA